MSRVASHTKSRGVALSLRRSSANRGPPLEKCLNSLLVIQPNRAFRRALGEGQAELEPLRPTLPMGKHEPGIELHLPSPLPQSRFLPVKARYYPATNYHLEVSYVLHLYSLRSSHVLHESYCVHVRTTY